MTSLLFAVTGEAEKKNKKSVKVKKKSPGCNFGKGCGNNLKLIGAGRESLFCPLPTAMERATKDITLFYNQRPSYLNDNTPAKLEVKLKEKFLLFVVVIIFVVCEITERKTWNLMARTPPSTIH